MWSHDILCLLVSWNAGPSVGLLALPFLLFGTEGRDSGEIQRQVATILLQTQK